MTAMYGLCAEGAESLDDLDAQLNPPRVDSVVDQANRRAALMRLGAELS